jgi:hypothetical protein
VSAKIIPFRKPTKRKKPKPEPAYCAERVIAGTQDPDLGEADRKPESDK